MIPLKSRLFISKFVNNGRYYLSNNFHSVFSYKCVMTVNDNKLNKDCFWSHPNRRRFSLEAAGDSYASFYQSVSQSKAAGLAKDMLITVHDTAGLPWWATIVVTTAGLRILVTCPLTIYQNYLIAKLELAKLEFSEIVKELKMETAVAIKKLGLGKDEARFAYNKSMKKQWRLLMERENCHPMKTTIVFWFQLPIWILFSITLRNMATTSGSSIESQIVALQMCVSGPLWAPNLLVPDPTLICPIVFFITNLVIIELQSVSRPGPPSKMQKVMMNIFRGVSLITLPIAMSVPSCMSFYWATSSLLALIQNVVLMSPALKQKFGVPRTPSHSDTPYHDALTNFKTKWKLSS